MAKKKKRNRQIQVSRAFGVVLGLVSIVGFLSIFLELFFNTDILSNYNEAIIFSMLGVGLIFEGKLFKLFRTARDGISSYELNKWVTSIIGVLILVSGLLAFLQITSPTINAVKGIASFIALIVIALEIFLVK